MPSWVYKITDKDDKCIYVGSTTGKYFCLRVAGHRKPSNKRQPKLTNYIAEKGGWTEFDFKIISIFETIEKQELWKLEKEQIALLNPICNSNNPCLTKEERQEQHRLTAISWRKNNPEKLKEQVERRKQTESHKEFVAKRCSTQIECECGGRYTLQNKTNHFSRLIHKQYEATKSHSRQKSCEEVEGRV
jgi:hypothetical protein